ASQRRNTTVGRRTVARGQDANLVPDRAQLARQAENLALYAAGNCQAVRADEADAHTLTVLADAAAAHAGEAGLLGCGEGSGGGWRGFAPEADHVWLAEQPLVAKAKVAGPVGLKQVPLLGGSADEVLELVGQHLGEAGDVVA